MTHLKKFLSIAVCLLVTILSMFTLSACNLVVTDKSAYYSQIIATYTYGDKEFNVSMDQLNTAFKEYGYNNYINGYYSTITDCLNDCLKYHIQSSLLTYELETKISEIYAETNNELYNISFADIQDHNWQKTLDNIYTSTNPNALEIRYNAFANMQSSIDSYCVDILEEEERFEEIKVEEEETLRDEKTEYVSKLVINETTGKVTRKVEDLKLFDETNVPTHFTLNNNYDKTTTNKAYNKFVNYLQQMANSEGKSTKESDVILEQEKNSIRNAYLSKLLELLEYRYETTNAVDTDLIVEYYINQFKAQKNKLQYNEEAYHTLMDKYTSEYVYYHANSGNEYVLMNHILINFTETQKQAITELEKQLELDVANFPNLEEELEAKFNEDVMSIVLNTQSEYEVNGNKQTGYITEIISEISNKVNTSVSGNNITNDEVKVRAEAFDELVYKYNDDPGAMNQDFKYAVRISNELDDKWEEAFALAAKDLFENYEVGDVLLEPVISSYGIHIVFYSGVAENVVDENAIDNLTYQDLLEKRVNPASPKTLFEYMYDKVKTSDSYDSYTSGLINQLYNESKITIDNYKFSNGLV